MPVTQGILNSMMGGTVISGVGTGAVVTTDGMGIGHVRQTGVDIQKGWHQWQLVDIGGTRLKNVIVTPLHDELLHEAQGQNVAISWHGAGLTSGGRHTVVAIRTPKAGVDRPGRGTILFVSLVWIVRFWLVAGIFGALLAVGGQLLFKMPLIGIVFALAWAGWGLVLTRRMLAAWSALGG